MTEGGRQTAEWIPCGNKYLDELMSTKCVCGNRKSAKKSFCFACYMLLPQDLKNDLYSRMGDGYEHAYDAGVVYLGGVRDES